MYRIELSPGEETAFRSIQELAVAIRRGVVNSKARIWHNASGKWLPIQFHPHYKAAAEMPLTQADLVAGPPVTPLSALSLPEPNASVPRVTGFRPVDSPPPSPAPAPLPRVAPSMPAPQKMESHPPAPAASVVSHTPSKPKKKPRSRKSSSRALRLALVGAFFMGGVQLVLSAGGALQNDGWRTQRRLISAQPEPINSDSPRTVAAVIPVLRNSSVPGGANQPTSSPESRLASSGMEAPANAGTVTSLPARNPLGSNAAPAIEAAPAVEMPATAPALPDSLTETVPDSTGKKVLKQILKSVSQPADTKPTRPKRKAPPVTQATEKAPANP